MSESTDGPILTEPESQKTSANPTAGETETLESVSELKPILLALAEKLEGLSEQIDFGQKFAEKKINEQIDKLWEENKGFKDSLIEQFKKKLVLGVIEQLDAADKQISHFETREESEKTYKNLLSAFREITGEFREMLQNRLDIAFFQSEEGEAFVAAKHNALGKQPTGDKSKDQTISRSKRYGYANNDGKILRPELVEVFYYDSSLAPSIPPDHEDSESGEPENNSH
ncbi:MAG: nucleotide exchange factor GrpE [Planctomycetaceae bacterium]|nr:nucleotide exchange factor GrpE [Planctomycetaceae bacterium]